MLTEKQIEKGFWCWDQENNHPPEKITLLEDYKTCEKLNLVITQIGTDMKYQNKLIDAWCEKLPELTEVKYLWLNSRVNQKIFDAICKLVNLEGLFIKWSGVKKIDNIQNLKNLKHFCLGSSSQVEDIDALGKLSNVITLDLENLKKISDFSVISNLSKLEGLGLDGSMYTAQKIDTLEPLRNLTELKYLTLTNSRILDKSFEAILNLRKLVRFNCSYNYPANEFEKLKNLPNLKYSNVHYVLK